MGVISPQEPTFPLQSAQCCPKGEAPGETVTVCVAVRVGVNVAVNVGRLVGLEVRDDMMIITRETVRRQRANQ